MQAEHGTKDLRQLVRQMRRDGILIGEKEKLDHVMKCGMKNGIVRTWNMLFEYQLMNAVQSISRPRRQCIVKEIID